MLKVGADGRPHRLQPEIWRVAAKRVEGTDEDSDGKRDVEPPTGGRRRSLAFSVETLMENAGLAVADFCLRQYPAAERAVVLCGKGNNGGDGIVAARMLAAAGVEVEVVLLGRKDEMKGDAAAALARLPGRRDGGSAARGRRRGSTRRDIRELLAAAELIVDAVVGTGFKPPLRGLAAVLREMISKVDVPVVAVDLPSGWDADSLEQRVDGAFRADAVVTFTTPKMAHVFGSLTGTAFGPVVVAEIGSPDAAVISESGLSWTGAAKAIAERPRDVNSNKGKYGHVLMVGGSYGTAGAPAMASLAAMRTGAGLVTAAVPRSIVESVAGITPELMVFPFERRD